MENKNNKTTNDLVDMILEVRKKQGNTSTGYAYATGVLIALLEWSRNSSTFDMQNEINSQYEHYEKELMALKLKDIQKVCNESKPEELYA